MAHGGGSLIRVGSVKRSSMLVFAAVIALLSGGAATPTTQRIQLQLPGRSSRRFRAD
jgi:hypothetical protein